MPTLTNWLWLAVNTSLNQSQGGNWQQYIFGKDVQVETYELKSIESQTNIVLIPIEDRIMITRRWILSEEEEFRFWINRFRHVKQEISLVRLGAGVPEVWCEVNKNKSQTKQRKILIGSQHL